MNKTKKLSRRTFLSVAATSTLPMLVPGSVLGKDGFFPPSETINVGLIGWGTRRSNIGSRPGSRFIAVCDIDTRRIPAEMGGHPVKGFQYYQEMYDMPDLDVVSIAAPDHWHTRMTIDACKAGKDVYCEKPLTFTLMESRQIVAAARKYDKVVSSGSQRVMEDYGRYLAPIIMSGAIGEVKEIYANCAGAPSERTYDPEPCPPEVDWDAWVGQAPYFEYSRRAIDPMTWRFNSAFGTGGLGDWGGHNFGGALYSCGMDHVAPKKVFAPNTDRNPFNGVKIEMENGVNFYHGDYPGAGSNITIVGTEGVYIFGKTKDIHALHAVDVRRYSGGADNIADDFLYCVRHRTRPFQDVFYGANVSDYGHMCIIAYKLQRDLVWDKDKMEFENDREATAMVSKIQRAPYQIEV
ncbi:MAG: Gfo/Idh/MocA family oxidoreductase [Thermoguttaceae bacterium]|nr:Gfo/Idh/MocA family oxidoreductase [Thermoguttaceae bacterium]